LLETVNGDSAETMGYSAAVETIKGTRPLSLQFAPDPVEEQSNAQARQSQSSEQSVQATRTEPEPEAEPEARGRDRSTAKVQRPDYSELVEVQYGAKGVFQQARLEITHGGELVLYTHTEPREEVQRAKLSGCTVAQPQKPRKGRAHAVRVDIAESGGTGDRRYVVSVGTSDELQTLKVFLQLHSEKATASGPGKKHSKKHQNQSSGPK
jgi:hypothetical protein